MAIYDALGKGVLSAFISITQLLSPAPLPKPEAVLLTPVTIPTATSTITTPLPEKENLPTKTIPIYLNYPEKISIAPIKTVDINFKKIFLYSIEDTSQKLNQTPADQNQISEREKRQIIIPSTPIATISSIQADNEERIKNSIVNIYCTIKIGKNIKVVTGSGVVVDPEGVVLTNAHVGQFPLLQGNSIAKNMNCEIRTGSPISNSYGVKPLYISKDWINKNFRNISQLNFSETGENDIALLQIVEKTTNNTLNKKFDWVSISASTPSTNDYVSIASYPASILASRGVNALLSVQKENLRVHNAFSFSETTQVDLIETTDSLHVQHGSSGGGVFDNFGKLAGIIAITVNGDNPSTRHARALTLSHIDNVIKRDTGKNLTEILSIDPSDLYNQTSSERNLLSKKLIEGSAHLFFQQ